MTSPAGFGAAELSALEGPAWLSRRRQEAFERFSAAPMPTEAEEIWRYSRIGQLDLDRYRPGGPQGPPPWLTANVKAAVGKLAGIVVVGPAGIEAAELDPALADRGVVLGGATYGSGEGVAREVMGSLSGDNLFAHMSAAFAGEVVVVDVPDKVSLDAPLVVVHWLATDDATGHAKGTAPASFPRSLVRVGEAGRAFVVEVVASGGGEGLSVPVLEAVVGDGASLSYVHVQRLGEATWQVGYQASDVGRDATLSSFNLALGGSYARLRTDSRITGTGGSTALLAAFLGGGDQMHDFRTMQDHVAPHTDSDLVFKGAVSGRAHSVYSGLIRVRNGARGANAFQTNRNLVLSREAHADSVPNLDIEENDVRCSHASAVGPIDEDQRYYLETRGIDPPTAERLLVMGFFDDILARVPWPAMRGWMRGLVAARIEGSAGG